jgi:hypothetical protein
VKRAGICAWNLIFVLFAAFTAFSPGGCDSPVSPRAVPAAGPHVLVVRIAGESPAQERTALPSTPPPIPAVYAISVSRPGTPPRSLGAADVKASGTEFSVQLSDSPKAGDIVEIVGFDSESSERKKCAEGIHSLPDDYSVGTSVSITLRPSTEGTGDVNLSVSLPGFAGDDAITAAELNLYQSLDDYMGGKAPAKAMRYRKNDTYGEGTDRGENLGSHVPIQFNDLPSGNYVVQIEFFRHNIRVSRLVQTIIVRDGLATDSWDGKDSALPWGTDKFASSGTELAALDGIKIDGTTIKNYAPSIYSYDEIVPLSAMDELTPSSAELTVAGMPGQAITVSLNGADKVSLTGGAVTLSPIQRTNTINITVAAPDRVTLQTYTVRYAYRHVTELESISIGSAKVDLTFGTYSYIKNIIISEAPPSSETLTITAGMPGQTIAASLNGLEETNKISLTQTGNVFTGTLTPMAAVNSIYITVTAPDGVPRQTYAVSYTYIYANADVQTEWYVAKDGKDNTGNGSSALPYATVSKALTKIKDAYTASSPAWPGKAAQKPVPARINIKGTISGTVAAIGDNYPPIILAGYGDGAKISGSLSANSNAKIILEDGLILGNGVSFSSNSSFIMNGGTISGNTETSGGGASFSFNSSFIMNGGAISGNTASSNGGGVSFSSSGSFVMNGGTISDNTAKGNDFKGGGGVSFSSNGSFIMNGGTISGNKARRGGGVYIGNSSSGATTFTMNGGTISGNNTDVDSDAIGTGNSGGGVYVASFSGGSTNTFIMNGGTISDNTASKNGNGGGVYVGGVTFSGDRSFIMNGGTISGNTAANGGGVHIGSEYDCSRSFTMSGGVISGNTATNYGGGVYVGSSKGANTFTMSRAAVVDTGNDVCLANNKRIAIAGDLTGTPPVARITLPAYTVGTPVLDGTYVSTNYHKFAVTPNNNTEWTINNLGNLVKK